MKVHHGSETMLELRDTGMGKMFLGILATAFGIVTFLLFLIPGWLFTHPIHEASLGLTLAMPWIMMSIGASLIFFSRSRRTIFDKTKGTVSIRRKGVAEKDTIVHPLADIAQIVLTDVHGGTGIAATDIHYLALAMKDGSHISLGAAHQQTKVIFGKSKLEEDRAMGEEIAAFLNVPFQEEKTELPAGATILNTL